MQANFLGLLSLDVAEHHSALPHTEGGRRVVTICDCDPGP
jgi:hypothetical protein